MRARLLGWILLIAGADASAEVLGQQDAAPASCRSGQVQWLVGGAQAAARERYCSAVAAPAVDRQPVRISTAAQGLRDVERRRIIEAELQQEQALYSRLQQTRSDAEALGRSRANLAALNAELARLPRSAPAGSGL